MQMTQPDPAKKIAKIKRGFTETKFLAEFNAFIEAGELEQALTLLIEILPRLSHSGMNRKEKLKHLSFAGRRLQHNGLGKYGVAKLQSKAKIAATTLEKFGSPKGGTFLDFGCGAHEPLAMATCFYANGFDRCLANDFLPIRAPEYAALSMYDIVTYMQNFPEEFLAFGQDVTSFRERISEMDLRAFYSGDFEGGMAPLKDVVEFKSCDIVHSGIERNSVSYSISFAVFEHVMDMRSVCQFLFDATAPGGLNRHYIDLADHRAYRHDGVYNKFTFLTEPEGPSNVNRLRMSEQIAAFEAAGFEILDLTTQREAIPEDTREKLLPKWQAMSVEDQETFGMTITLRKP